MVFIFSKKDLATRFALKKSFSLKISENSQTESMSLNPLVAKF